MILRTSWAYAIRWLLLSDVSTPPRSVPDGRVDPTRMAPCSTLPAPGIPSFGPADSTFLTASAILADRHADADCVQYSHRPPPSSTRPPRSSAGAASWLMSFRPAEAAWPRSARIAGVARRHGNRLLAALGARFLASAPWSLSLSMRARSPAPSSRSRSAPPVERKAGSAARAFHGRSASRWSSPVSPAALVGLSRSSRPTCPTAIWVALRRSPAAPPATCASPTT